MSEQKWTKEPWSCDGETIRDNGGRYVLASCDPFCEMNAHDSEADSSRIVACVNGCTGLNPEAFAECVEALDLVKAYSDKEAGKGYYNGELPCHIASAVDDAIANARKVSA